MSLRALKGYVLVVASGLVLAAGLLLVILQARNPAEFSLYGKNISIRLAQDGKAVGGVNTALLMICSAVGGALAIPLVRVMISGWRSLTKARQQRLLAQVAKGPPQPERPKEPPTPDKQ